MDDFNYLIPSKNNAVNVVDGLPTTSMHVVEAVVPDHKKDVVRDYEKEETPLDGIYFIQFQDTPHHDLQQNALVTVLQENLNKMYTHQEELMKSWLNFMPSSTS